MKIPFFHRKEQENEESESELDYSDLVSAIKAAFTDDFHRIDTQLDEIRSTCQRIDKRHYRAKAQGNGAGDLEQDNPDDWSWVSRMGGR